MALKQFSDEIARFLRSKDPDVLCITGKWGVGKTFAWNHYLLKAKEEGRIALTRYAYVSLFGQNSLEDVRYALFESTISSTLIGGKADLDTLQASIETITGRWRGAIRFGKYIPKVGDFADGIVKLGFFNVYDQIVCIDDLERAGLGLKMKDILGLVSFLKEQRGCKVALLLNDEALAGVENEDFEKQLEKVADTVLRFDPTPQEAAEVGIDKSTDFHELLAADCVALGIVNIRAIKRIERFTKRLSEDLSAFDPRVLKQAIHSATLFIYAKFQPDSAPSLEFIKTFSVYDELLAKSTNRDAPHSNWRALLKQYDFLRVDEFDKVIFQGVEQGQYGTDALKTAAENLQRQLKLSDADTSFSEVWNSYHDSFDDNLEAVLDGMEFAIMNSSSAITPMNLSGTITFLKEMGRGESVGDLLEQYIDTREEEPEFWDLSNHPFRDDIKDPDVLEAFRRKFATLVKKPEVADVLKRIGANKSWTPEDVRFLASTSVEDFFVVFKAFRGIDLRQAIYGALMFREISNASAEMKTITNTAEEALKKIGRESTINARRVRSYGLDVRNNASEVDYASWRLQEILSLRDASILWSEMDPATTPGIPLQAESVLICLKQAIQSGELRFVPAQQNATLEDIRFSRINADSSTNVRRSELKQFASARGRMPAFLRDD
jgi:KAP family P-loop domain